MYESAFNNLQSSYMNNDNSYSSSESIFSKDMKSSHLKGVSDSDPFASQSVFLNWTLDNKSDTMYGNNQNSIDYDKSIYIQNGELEVGKDTLGVIDRSRDVNESINIDQTKQVSLQGRFTNTNTVEDLSLIGDRDSARTLQGRRTNTNSVEDNSIFNNESVTHADDFHKHLDEGKEKKPEKKGQEGSMALLEIQEKMMANQTGQMSEDEERSANISHATREVEGGIKNKPQGLNVSSMDVEDDEEKNNLKTKQRLKRNDKNYNQSKYEDISDDDLISSQITHTVQRTMSDYLSKY